MGEEGDYGLRQRTTDESNMKQRTNKGARFDPKAGELTRLHETGEHLLPDGQTKNYQFLDVGPCTSLVTDVLITKWGSEILVSCLYDPLGATKPYQVLFTDCMALRWEVHSPEYVRDSEADVIGFELISEARDHALIHTDIFELAIWYGSYKVLKKW